MKTLRMYCICLALAALMTIQPPAPTQAAGSFKERKATLCGQLAFLTDERTGQTLMGLTPCGSSRPLIFITRPGKLYNYYRFKDVVIVKGDRIRTREYGTIEYFIEKFDEFIEIQDCRSCQVKAPTHTPIPRRASLNCGDYLLSTGQEIFPELADAAWQAAAVEGWEAYAAGNELYAACGQDSACQGGAAMLRIGETLGARLSRSPANRDRMILFLYERVKDPAATAACPDLAWTVRFLAAGLSRQGFAIDALAASSPATLRVTDRLGRQAGVLANGALAEEILAAKTAVTGLNKLVLLPGGLLDEPPAAEMIAAWTDAGPARLELAVNRSGEVWLISFEGVNAAAGGWARLDLAGEPPWLQMTAADAAAGSIAAGSVAAAGFTRLSVDAAWLPTPTAWPTATLWAPTDTATPAPPAGATPAPAAVASATQPPASTSTPAAPPPAAAPSACPFSAALAALPVLFGLTHVARRKASSNMR